MNEVVLVLTDGVLAILSRQRMGSFTVESNGFIWRATRVSDEGPLSLKYTGKTREEWSGTIEYFSNPDRPDLPQE